MPRATPRHQIFDTSPRTVRTKRGLVALLLFGFACGDAPDARVDAPVAPIDAPTDAPTPPSVPGALASTSGGGRSASAGHRIHVRIGAPEPMGRAASAGHRITTGPGALPWANR